MKILKLTLIFAMLTFMAIFMMNSCKNDNEEELYGNDTIPCDTSNVTYSGTMKSFFDAQCTSCHYDGNQYPFLENFATAHDYAISNGNTLFTKIKDGHQGTNVTVCEKIQLQKWINSGAN